VFGAPTSVEADAINAVIDEYVNQPTGMNAFYEGSDSFEEQVVIRVEGGNPPDLALYPQPGAVIEQAEAGRAVSLESMGFDIDELRATFGDYLISLGEHEGEHYAIPTNANLKSLIWYNIPVFEAEGYEKFETTLGGDGVGVLWPAVLKNGTEEDEEGGMEIDVEKFLNAEGTKGVEKLVGVYGQTGEREGWKFWRVESE
jgi:hypothetical protein